jgi:hypothetical protein
LCSTASPQLYILYMYEYSSMSKVSVKARIVQYMQYCDRSRSAVLYMYEYRSTSKANVLPKTFKGLFLGNNYP